LEAEIAKLKNQNGQLTNQVGQLVIENRDLKDELQKLHTLVKKTGLSIPEPKVSKSETSSQQKTKAGVCLLILMLSFGLFFNVGKGPAKSFFERNINRIRTFEPAGGSSLFTISGNTGARTLKSLEDTDPKHTSSEPILSPPQPLVNGRIENGINYQQTPLHKIPIVERRDNPEEKRYSYGVQNTGIPSSSHEEIDIHKRIMSQKTEDNGHQFMAEFAEMMNESLNHNVSELQDAEMQKWFSERLKVRPNTAFFSVTDFQQIIPPNMQPFDSNSPFFVSLLLPARSLANQLPSTTAHAIENTIIEVTCQVVAVNQTNLNLNEVNNIRQVPVM